MDSKPSVEQRVAELDALIRAGKSFSEAVDTLAPERRPNTKLMRRASAVTMFDQRLFDDVIRVGFRGVSFDDFVGFTGVHRTSPRRKTYGVDEAVAVDHLRAWIATQGDRDELIKLLTKVHEHLQSRPDAGFDDLYRLRFQLVGTPDEGLKEFERRFEAADKAFELATCHALVQVMRDLDVVSVGDSSVDLKLLTPEQRARSEELGPYIAARGRFIEEYVKSADYLQRAELLTQFNEFLNGDANWLFPVYGPGGRGKTMFMRWLVARRCLPLPDRIPVAKVDFDDLNTVKLVKFPWLILLTLAEQLNRQMPGAPFTEFLARHADFAPILLPTGKLHPGIRIDGLESELEQSPSVKSVTQDFAFKLGDRQVVVVLDTLEEPVLHFPGALHEVLDTFRAIRSTTAGRSRLKLVLCGRYNLQARGYLKTGEPEPVEIGPFIDNEAREYLEDKRHVDGVLVKAIIDKAQGNPFILSLIADLVSKEDITDVPGVERLKPEYAYLIERVIKRIPEDQWAVRWVVRYGVVPRRLTRSFLEHVMQPHLRRETLDSGVHMDAVAEYRESFPRKGELDVLGLWSALRSYADSIGWLRGDDSELRFQPEVVQPMRELLAQERIYRQLHEEAARWFEEQARAAANDPVSWADSQAEVFHHRLHLGATDLEHWFQRCLQEPQAQEPKARNAMLEAVATLLPIPGAVPLDATGAPLLSYHFVQWAHYELAHEAAGIAWGPMPAMRQPETVRRLLESMRSFESTPETPSARVIEVALCVNARDYEKALDWASHLESSVQYLPDLDQYAFHLLKARALIGRSDSSAEQAYRSAIDVAERNGHPAWALLSECCRELVLIGQVASGLGVARRALQISTGVPVDFLLDAAELFLRTGEHEQAEALARRASADYFRSPWLGSAKNFRTHRVLVACAIERGHGMSAREEFSGMAATGSVNPLQSAQFDELGGMLAASAFEIDVACSWLQKAARGFAAAGDRDAANTALLRALQALKDLKGDWAGAHALASRSSSLGTDWLAIEQAHLQYLLDEEPVPSAVREGKPMEGPRNVTALLTSSDRSMDRLRMQALLRHLEAVEYLPLRHSCLHWFRWLPALAGVSDLEDEFMQLVPAPKPGEVDFFPRVFGSIELLRCLGSASVTTLIHQAFAEAFTKNAFVCERLLEAAQRAGFDLRDIDAIIEQCKRFEGQALDVATRILLVSILLERGDERAKSLADAMSTELPECLRGTRFEAMHCANRWFVLAKQNDVSANAFAEDAAAIWRALGREHQARRLLAQCNAGPPESTWAAGRRLVVDLRAVPSPLESMPISEAVTFDTALLLLEDEQQLVRRMRDALPDAAMTAPAVELGIDSAPSQSLPWEWALPRTTVCFRSSRNLPSGSSHPLADMFWQHVPANVRRGLHYFTPLRIALLRPSSAYQHKTRRGFEVTAGRSLAEILRAHGSKVFEPAVQTPAGISDLLRNERYPHLIYIQAPVIERRGQLSIDIPLSEEARGEATTLDVDFWVHQVRLVRGDREPVVLLAPPRPADDVEVARQLLLRNEFASDLARRAKVRAVICAGLFEPMQVELAAERMAFHLTGNPPLQQVLMLLRNELPGDRFCTNAAALFTTDPSGSLK